jgi:hypothetical protein
MADTDNKSDRRALKAPGKHTLNAKQKNAAERRARLIARADCQLRNQEALRRLFWGDAQ